MNMDHIKIQQQELCCDSVSEMRELPDIVIQVGTSGAKTAPVCVLSAGTFREAVRVVSDGDEDKRYLLTVPCTESEPEQLVFETAELLTGIKLLAESGKKVTVLFFDTRNSSAITAGSLLCTAGKSLSMTAPYLEVRYVRADEPDMSLLLEESRFSGQGEVVYKDRRRYTYRTVDTQLPSGMAAPLSGTAIISGGLGRLSSYAAEYLLEHTSLSVLLIGRRDPDNSFAERFGRFGDRIKYIQADICQKASLTEKIFSAVSPEQISCVIHAAGRNDGKFISQKQTQDFIQTLAVKIVGTHNLSGIAERCGAECFASFSSLAAVEGDFVQGDYAAANLFLNRFSEQKNLCGGSCRYLSIGWPLWRDGGMHLSREAETSYLNSKGYSYLENTEGISLLLTLMQSGKQGTVTVIKTKETIHMRDNMNNMKDRVTDKIAGSIFDLSGIKPDQLDMELGFGELGFDSISLNDLAKTVNCEYGLRLSPVDFFTLSTPEKLAEHICAQMPEMTAESKSAEEENVRFEDRFADLDNDKPFADAAAGKPVSDNRSYEDEPIAIIGMDCIMPDAESKESFWKNLMNGMCSIHDVPENRKGKKGGFEQTEVDGYRIRAGFLGDVSSFDREFFKMNPKECEYMDPQQRLYIQVVWHALEDAGWQMKKDDRRNVGVFTGIQHLDYKKLLSDNGIVDSAVALGNEAAMISNRISYMLDLKGPSISVNTACSSSLAALHQAVSALRRHECDMAVAGGVCIYLTKDSFAVADKMGILSSYGECRALDDSAAGYVKGEGIGAVVLKPLHAAVRDRDNIYCVVRSTLTGHGGHAQSVTSPRSDSQASLIESVMKQAGIAPDSISYTELHGTGTHLGDPVEIEAMKQAFASAPHESCYIGSVKNNIGHLEPASGIASIIKAALCLQNKQIPPHINYKTENRYLELKESPFCVNTVPVSLKRKTAGGKDLPLRILVNSFGFGGTNCCAVLEEYAAQPAGRSNSQNIFILSAMNDARLDRKIAQYTEMVRERVENGGDNSAFFDDMCWTLQCRKKQYSSRFAVVCSSLGELNEKLRQYAESGKADGVVRGDGNTEASRLSALFDNEGAAKYAEFLRSSGSLDKIAAFWAIGMDFDWSSLFHDGKTVSLPLEPFEKNRYWFDSYKESKNELADVIGDRITIESSDIVQLYYIEDNIAVLVLADKKNKNMFSEKLISQLSQCLATVSANKALKALVLTGYDNIFCMGGSKEELLELQSGRSVFSDASVIYKGLLELNIPVISAMQGIAFGGGLAFGLYGDIVIMAEEAFYSANFMKYGFTPGLGSTYILKQKLGENLANYMMFSADVITGAEIAQKNGSVIVKKASEVLSEAVNTAKRIAQMEAKSISLLKANISGVHLYMMDRIIENELEMHSEVMETEEVRRRIDKYFIDVDEPRNQQNTETVKPLNLKKKVVIPAENTEYKAADTSFRKQPEKEEAVTASAENEAVRRTEKQPEKVKTAKVSDVADKTADICMILCDVLHIDPDAVDNNCPFSDLGMDSINLIDFTRQLNKKFSILLDTSDLYDYNCVSTLNTFIMQKFYSGKKESTASEIASHESQDDKILALLSSIQADSDLGDIDDQLGRLV